MSAEPKGPRRSNHATMPVAYAAIGASSAPDLMRFPPADSTPYEESLQLGSGSQRFHLAANLLMTWGAQRVAGVEVTEIEAGDASEYPGVHFTEAGTPEVGAAREELFTPEGEPYLVPGTTASFSMKRKKQRRVLIVSTVIETHRLGFVWGDRDEVPGYGEQQLTVELREDGTVWAIARGFAYQPNSKLVAGLTQRANVREVVAQAQTFLEALSPGAAIRTGIVTSPEEEADTQPATGENPSA
ncbi:MAG: DUF1990 family protein [Leucobacter sp.]